jgi:hypothetical protein
MPPYPSWKEGREGSGKVVRVFPIAHQGGLPAYRIRNRRYASLARRTLIRSIIHIYSVPIERTWVAGHDFPQGIYKPHIGIRSFSIDICVYGTTYKPLMVVRVDESILRGMKVILIIAGL